jgi:hypothetical protein
MPRRLASLLCVENLARQNTEDDMTLGLIFWILMLIWFVFSVAVFGGMVGGTYAIGGGALLHFILFLILGWQAFGAPIRRGA